MDDGGYSLGKIGKNCPVRPNGQEIVQLRASSTSLLISEGMQLWLLSNALFPVPTADLSPSLFSPGPASCVPVFTLGTANLVSSAGKESLSVCLRQVVVI